MASEIKVDNIKDQCGTAVITKCGATHTVTAEVYKADTIQDTSGNAYLAKCGSTVTLGGCGQTIELAAGASQTGFGRSGSVNWDTTAKTASFTAVSGNGYFVNTTSGAITVTLPASPSAGDIVAIADYAGTFTSNNVTVGRNGSNIRGSAVDFTLNVTNQTATLIYVDGTQGWNLTQESNNVNNFIVATGGTETECGDFKIHTFTGPGTFTVTNAGSCSGSNTVDYLVTAGGGGGGAQRAGGGGAGGFRTSFPGGTQIPVTATGYPITVGGGGAGGTCTFRGPDGNNSVFSTITSAGGGGGGAYNGTNDGKDGGSGGGASRSDPGDFPTVAGSGNTPPVSPPQGNNGGGYGINSGGGGGGSGAVGQSADTGSPPYFAGNGGVGLANLITGSPVFYSGGGGGGQGDSGTPAGTGGTGGGGAGSNNSTAATSGTANTGGGGGGGGNCNGGSVGGAGGSGIVIIRYKFQ